MDVKIRYIKKNELQKLVSFNRANYRAGHILTDKKYLDWQFGAFPSSLQNYTVLGVFNGRNDLLGVFGLTFLNYLYFGTGHLCIPVQTEPDKNRASFGERKEVY